MLQGQDRCLCLLKVNLIMQRFLVKDFILNCVFPLEPLKQQFYFPIQSGTKPKQFTSSSSRVAKVFVYSLIMFPLSEVIDGPTFYLPSATLQIADAGTTCLHHVSSGYRQEQQIT